MVRAANYSLKEEAKTTRLNSLLTWIDTHAERMLADPAHGLEAIGVGKKNADSLDAQDCDWSLVGFVKKKLPEKKLKSSDMVAFAAGARAMVGMDTALEAVADDPFAEHELDVIECGSSFSTNAGLTVPVAQRGVHGGTPPTVDFQKPFTAIRIGVGITNPVGSYDKGTLGVGTLGFCVQDSDGAQYLVSNNHVIGRENSARTGNAVVQPGTLDLTQTELNLMNTLNKLRKELQIAKVSAVVDMDFNGNPNEVDTAMAQFTGERDLTQLGRIGFGGRVQGIAAPYTLDANGAIVGETRVYKAGRTTGWTEGNLTAIAVSSPVGYSKGTALFRNQLAITPTPDTDGPFSNKGDSGSGIIDTNNNLVGLLFAGSTSRTLANPIDLVMSALTAELGKGPLTLIT